MKNPLPDTVRVLDEITTDFIQGVSLEATRAAQHAGRQKLKFEDFEFAMRRNSLYMGKVQEVFEKKKEIERARNIINDEDQIMRDANRAEKEALRSEKRAAKTAQAKQEEELGEADDDADAEAETLGAKKRSSTTGR